MEEKVDLDSIVLSPSGLFSNKEINEPSNDIKEEQSSLNPLQDSNEKSTFINKVHKPEVQQSVGAKQAKLQFKCKVCGVQSTDLNWFTKHVAEHQQKNLPILEESVLKLQKSVLKIKPKILQSSSKVNEPKSMVNEHEFKDPLLNESNEDKELQVSRIKIFPSLKNIKASNITIIENPAIDNITEEAQTCHLRRKLRLLTFFIVTA